MAATRTHLTGQPSGDTPVREVRTMEMAFGVVNGANYALDVVDTRGVRHSFLIPDRATLRTVSESLRVLEQTADVIRLPLYRD